MKYYLKSLAAGAALVSVLAAVATPASAARAALAAPAPAGGLAADRLWDDGQSELSQYEGSTLRYGEPRATHARIVIVKEDMLLKARVKSERGPKPGQTAEALKIVFVAEFNTGSYFYRQAATTFLDRATLEVMKESMTHFDGCGVTYVQVKPRLGRMVHEAHSYWEGEADREVPIVWPAGGGRRAYWDALPLWLREDFPPELRARPGGAKERAASATIDRGRIVLLPSQVGGRSPIEATKPVSATLHWRDAGSVDVPAGRFAAALAEVVTPGGADRFWFDAAYPHVLLRMETAAGRTLALRRTQRIAYWKHHAEGDEKHVD